MAQLTLYDFAFSPNARKVRMALAEKGMRYEKVNVDLMKGEQRKPDYLRLNPHGKVPTLMVDGTPIYESSAIIEYLEETCPNPPLLPKDPLARARARMIDEVVDHGFQSPLRLIRINTTVRPPAERNEKEIEECKKSVAWYDEWLDRELAETDYLASSSVSLADLAAFCNMGYQLSLKIEIDPKHKNLKAWHERMSARPSAKM
jgi:maleylacetoacetate isomerase